MRASYRVQAPRVYFGITVLGIDGASAMAVMNSPDPSAPGTIYVRKVGGDVAQQATTALGGETIQVSVVTEP